MTAPIAALLQPIKDRLNAATPGPWEWSKEEDVWGDCGPNLETTARGPVYSDGSQGAEVMVIGSWGHDANGIDVEPHDAAFIAAAPTDQAKLIAAVEAVEALLCGPNDIAVPANQPDLVPPFYSDRIRAALTTALESAA